jgi:YfiH family protein
MLSNVQAEIHPLGLIARSQGIVAFFGNRRATEPAVAEAFPDFNFRYLRQAHGARVVPSLAGPQTDVPEADAHWTRDRGIALAIRTADCLPVLLASAERGAIAAIHAGWRGLESEIILQSLVSLLDAGFPPPEFQALVGPGIGPDSFEVGLEVAERLEGAFRKARFDQSETSLLPHGDFGKRRVNLVKIAFAQLRAAGLAERSVSGIFADTFADPTYFSFRREREGAGRQVSFIAMA